MANMKFDLSSSVPEVELRLSPERVITLGLDELFDYACLSAEKGTLRERMPVITNKFNEDFDCNVSEGNLYLVMFNCLQKTAELMGN